MRFFFAWFLLIAFFLVSRVYNLEGLPLFSDEAYAVARTWELGKTGELLGMIKYTTQPIFIWLVALFGRLPLGSIVSSRLVSAIAGLGTALVLAKLARKWIGSKAGFLTFILVTILPFSVFYDRTILFESTTLFFMSLSLIFPLAAGLAILTKQTGWLILPAVIATGQGNFKKRFLEVVFSVVAVVAVWYLAMVNLDSILEIVLGKTSTPVSAAADFKNNLLRSKLWLINYLTIPVILLTFLGAVVAIIESVKKKKMKPLAVVALWTLGIFLLINKIAVIFYPRYLYPVVLGIVLLGSKGWFEYSRRFKIIGSLLMSFLILAPAMTLSSRIVTTPQLASLPREDKFQFFEDWTSGVGSSEIADEIIKISGGEDINVYLEEENSYFITLKSDSRLKNARVEIADWLVDPLTEIPEEILSGGKFSVFVRNRHPDIPRDWPVEKIFSFNKTAVREVSLYRVAEGSDLLEDLILQQ